MARRPRKALALQHIYHAVFLKQQRIRVSLGATRRQRCEAGASGAELASFLAAPAARAHPFRA
jgi:hypothetical protein